MAAFVASNGLILNLKQNHFLNTTQIIFMGLLTNQNLFCYFRYNLVPYGSHSFLESLTDKSKELPLYGSGGFRFFWDTKYVLAHRSGRDMSLVCSISNLCSTSVSLVWYAYQNHILMASDYNTFLPEANFGLRVLSLLASVCVCVSVRQSRVCPCSNSSTV